MLFFNAKKDIENNRRIIFSNEYKSKLAKFIGIESSYLIKSNKALKQMIKVKEMLSKSLF